MRFRCDQCERELVIPDDKLPEAQRFKVKCPHCQQETILDRNWQDSSKAPPKTKKKSKKKSAGVGAQTLEPEVFPPGSKVYFHFVDDDDWQEGARNFFMKMGFHESTASSPEEAALKLRLNDYNVIIVEDAAENGAIVEEIGFWNGNKRREVNVVLLSQEAASLDPKMAFERGVNSVLNMNDSERAEELLESTLIGYQEYYRLYNAAVHWGSGKEGK